MAGPAFFTIIPIPYGGGGTEDILANEHYKSLSYLLTGVRDQLDEASPSFWTDAQLTRYINRALSRARNRLKEVNENYLLISRTSLDGVLTIQGESYDTSNFRIVSGTSDYYLPPDFDQLAIIECIQGGYENVLFTRKNINDPEFRSLRTLTSNQEPGDEIYFDIIGEPAFLRIAPKTNVTLNMSLSYIPTLTELASDTDRIFLPDPMWQSVADYACYYALRQDRSPDATAFEASGDKLIAEKFGAEMRQTQDVQTARSYPA